MLLNLERLKVVASYLEEAGGVSPKKWEKMSQPEREDYIEKHPTSKYAKKNKNNSVKKSNNKKNDYSCLENPFILPNGKLSNKTVGDIINKCVDIIKEDDEIYGTHLADKLKKAEKVELPWGKDAVVDFIRLPLDRDDFMRKGEEGYETFKDICDYLKDNYDLDFDYNNDDRYDDLYFFACDEKGNVLNWEDENRPCNLYGKFPWEK